jgi:hypothetical protein
MTKSPVYPWSERAAVSVKEFCATIGVSRHSPIIFCMRANCAKLEGRRRLILMVSVEE